MTRVISINKKIKTKNNLAAQNLPPLSFYVHLAARRWLSVYLCYRIYRYIMHQPNINCCFNSNLKIVIILRNSNN